MESLILIFTASCAISFIGSLQLGPVNLFVINTVLFENKKSAFWIAAGGCIPEFIYCALAIYANSFFRHFPIFDWLFKVILVLLLIVIGFVFWFKKKHTPPINQVTNSGFKEPIQYITKGFSLAALNPQLLPFWLFVQVYFNATKYLVIKTEFHEIAFILGAGFGALLLLVLLIKIIEEYKTKLLPYIAGTAYFKVLGFLFFALALHQLFLLYNIAK